MSEIYPHSSPYQLGTTTNLAGRANRTWQFLLLLSVCCLLSIGQAAATHFRYGSVSWRVVESDPSGRTVEFKVSQAWEGAPALGEAPYETMFNFGDRRSKLFAAPATFVNTAENYYFAQTTFTRTYPSTGNYVASWGACCRIPDLVNNAGGSYNIGTLVNIGNGNSSPVSTLAPIINLPGWQTQPSRCRPTTLTGIR